MPAEQPAARGRTLAVSGVLAQFGGVTLAFAWIATIGPVGVVTVAVADLAGIDLYGCGWLFGLPGLVVVYCYFQIPLMVIVFAPAFEGLRPQWREAAVNLGASTWAYWRHVAIPLLTPAFLGAMLLLFANAFAAYATAAVLVSQGQPDRAAPHPPGHHERGPPRPGQRRLRARAGDDRRGDRGDGGLQPPAATYVEVDAMSPSPLFRIVRAVVLLAFAAYFFVPLLAMLDFSTQVRGSAPGRTWDNWELRLHRRRLPRLDHRLAAAGAVHRRADGRAAGADDGVGAAARPARARC